MCSTEPSAAVPWNQPQLNLADTVQVGAGTRLLVAEVSRS
jgi:hypothetical protein